MHKTEAQCQLYSATLSISSGYTHVLLTGLVTFAAGVCLSICTPVLCTTSSNFLREEGVKDKQLDSDLIPVQKAVFQLAKSGAAVAEQLMLLAGWHCVLRCLSCSDQQRQQQQPSGAAGVPAWQGLWGFVSGRRLP